MVAAALGIGSAVSGIGSALIGSESAGNATAAQRQLLERQLGAQMGLLQNYDPQLRELQAWDRGVVSDTRDQGVNALRDFTGAAGDTLRGYAGASNDLLRYYFPQAQDRVSDYGGYAQNYFEGAKGSAYQQTQNAIDAIRGGVNSGFSTLASAGDEVYQQTQNAIDAIRGGVGNARGYLTGAGDRATGILNPYIAAGSSAADQLRAELSSGALGAQPSLTDFSQLPGYQFTLDQGLKAARNSASASGYGGVGASGSGPLGKALTQYAEGLANTFGSQYLQNYWANQNNRYNILSGTAGMGSQAGSNLSSLLANLGSTGAGIEATGGANIAGAESNLNSILANIRANQGNIQAQGGANIAGAESNLNQILSAIAANQGSTATATGSQLANLSSTLGSTLANLYSGLGTGLSNLQSGLGSNISNFLTGNTNQYLAALNDPMKMLMGLATNTGANFNSAISNASGGIANSIQNQGNILGAGLSGGVNSGISNYLLYNALRPGGSGSSGTGGLYDAA